MTESNRPTYSPIESPHVSPGARVRRMFERSLVLAAAAFAAAPQIFADGIYDFPTPPVHAVRSASEISLAQESRALVDLTREAKKALVFIGVSKVERQLETDPREFFFGPNPGFLPGHAAPGAPRELRRFSPGGQGGARGPRSAALGSGFIVDLAKGYVLTNNHVVQDADEIQLKLANGQSSRGKIIARDPKTDLAVVEVSQHDFERKGLAALALGDSDVLDQGEIVLALGAPFGLEASVSRGIVSAIGRGALDIAELGDFIQTDAAINPGMSGGPLLNTKGEVIGVNTAIYSPSGAYNGIGFAVPSNIVRTVARELINSGTVERGYLGIALQAITTEGAKELHLPTEVQASLSDAFRSGGGGALVAKVSGGSPAERAGFKEGDVIIRVNDRATATVQAVTTAIGLLKPKSAATFKVYRSGKETNLDATIGAWPKETRS